MSRCGVMKGIEGRVQPCFLDSICLAHRICIMGTDGHVYEVEPNYVGLYLERFIGFRVVVQGELVTSGKHRSVVRISSLKVLAGKGQHDRSEDSTAAPPDTDGPDGALRESEIGVSGASR